MKKIYLLNLAIVAAGILALTGCPPPPPPPPPPVDPIVTPTQTEGIVLDGASNYTVVKGDTLSDIAGRRYGSGNMLYFPLIRLANAGTVKDPDVIEPGTKLVIPDLQRNLNSAGAKAAIRQDMLATAQQYERKEKPKAAAALKNLAAQLAK
jgi:LysM repeat protein